MSLTAAVTGAGQRLAALPADGPTLPDFGDVRYVHHLTNGGTVEIDASNLQLALHIGDGFSAIISMMFRFIMEIVWGGYSASIRISAWFADVAMGMGWIQLIRAPFDSIEGVVRELLQSFNLYGVMLVVTAFVCAIWIARGKWGQGLAELMLAVAIANVAVASIGGSADNGTLATHGNFSPLEVMIGPVAATEGQEDEEETEEEEPDPCANEFGSEDEGLVYEVRDAGRWILTDIHQQMASGGRATGCAEYDPMRPSDSIVQTFVWYPLQLVNFGEVLSPRCADAYAITLDAIESGVNGEELKNRLRAAGLDNDGGDGEGNPLNGVGEHAQYLDEGWKVPGACQHDDADGAYDDQANYTGLLTQIMLIPSIFVVVLVVLVMAFFVVVAGVNAVLQCLKLLGALLFAILPSGARRPLWMTVGAVVASLGVLLYLVIAFGVYLLIINEIYANHSNGGIWQRLGTLLLIDFLMLVGLFMLWRGKKSVEQMKEKISEAMSRLVPGGGGGGGGGGKFGAAAAGAAGGWAMNKLAGRAFGGGNTMAGIRARELDHDEHKGRLAGIDGAEYARAKNPGKAEKLRKAHERRQNPSPMRKVLRTGLRVGKSVAGKAALGFLTGGVSLAVQGGAALVKSRAGKFIGRAVANRTIGRKSKLGNAARRGMVRAGGAIVNKRNQIAQGWRGRSENRRRSRSVERIKKQRQKVVHTPAHSANPRTGRKRDRMDQTHQEMLRAERSARRDHKNAEQQRRKDDAHDQAIRENKVLDLRKERR